MKKLFFCTLLTIVGLPFGKAQSNEVEVQRVEGELRVGLTAPLGGFHGGSATVGPAFGVEIRYNIPKSSWDMGFQINATTAVRKFHSSNYTYEQSNRSVNYLLSGGYNFGQGKKVNPFVGAGFGLNFYDAIDDVVYDGSGKCFTFAPRVGVELFHHLRFTLTSNITRTGYSNIEFTIGGVIGGRPKKR